MRTIIHSMVLILVVLLFVEAANADEFDVCGTFRMGPNQCLGFISDGGDSYLIVTQVHPSLINTHHRLVGEVDLDCITFCQIGPCVTVDSVLNCIPTDVGSEEPSKSLPDKFVLKQNYPNPFNPNTTILYTLATPSQVRLAIYNILGQEVRQFDEGFKPAGNHEVRWGGLDNDGQVLASGVYFYRLETDAQVETRKMLLLK